MASPDVLLGAGLYETVRVSDGRALHGERHLERMTASAHALGLPAPARSAFAAAIVAAAGAGDIVRIRLHAAGEGDEAELSGERRPALASGPVRLTALGGWYAPGYLLREHKLTSHFHGVQGRRLAQAAGYDDALLVAHDGRVGEASNANVAVLAGGALVTPSVDGLLPGVCRAALLEAARALGLAVETRAVALAELVDADAVLLTSSPRGLSEVAELDGHVLRRLAPDVLAVLREGVAAAAQAHALALP
jgi:branched-subunit amino acid aminotransferase/4-amino-4-deoxychorismate lyase